MRHAVILSLMTTVLVLFPSMFAHASSLNQILEQLQVEQKSQQDLSDLVQDTKSESLDEWQSRLLLRKEHLKNLNATNRALEEKLLQLQKRLNQKQQQVLESKKEIEGIINLAIAQQDVFITNGQQHNTWPLISHPSSITPTNFSVDALKELWMSMNEQLVFSGQVMKHEGELIQSNGMVDTDTIYIYGPFSQYSEHHGWSVYDAAEQAWRQLDTQPDFSTDANTMAIDTTFGPAMSHYKNVHPLIEKYQQSGLIGALILLLALIGFGIGSTRIWNLSREQKKINEQLKDLENLSSNNILGRVIDAVQKDHQQPNKSQTLLEDILDANVTLELPKLNRGIGTIAVFAAIAPLLGLLGTVGGMIETFTVITTQGTANSELLSGGIAEALLTTKLGLIAAIPLLLLHTVMKTKAQGISEVLEHQLSGLVVSLRHGIKHG